jgi:hypothetical protein
LVERCPGPQDAAHDVQRAEHQILLGWHAVGFTERPQQRPLGDVDPGGEAAGRRRRRCGLDHGHGITHDRGAIEPRPARDRTGRLRCRQAGGHGGDEVEAGGAMGFALGRPVHERASDTLHEVPQPWHGARMAGDPATHRQRGSGDGAVHREGDRAPGMGVAPDLDPKVRLVGNDEQRIVVKLLGVDDVRPRMGERQEDRRPGVRVRAVAKIATTLLRHLQENVPQGHDAQRPTGGLDRVADEPEVGAADGIRPGIEIIEGYHGIQNKDATRPVAIGRLWRKVHGLATVSSPLVSIASRRPRWKRTPASSR